MKKINEMKAERAELISKMETISNGESLNDELRAEWSGYDTQVKTIDNDITLAERQEELNKQAVRKEENIPTPVEERKSVGVQFRDWMFEAVEKKDTPAFRADPLLSSTDTGLINKTIAPGIDVLKSPALEFLKSLGITFFTGLNGNLCLNSMAEDTATFPGENTGAASYSAAPTALTLTARRVTHTQAITKETLAQSNPTIYNSIVQNLVDGLYNAVANDAFDTLQTDAPGQRQTAGITFADIAALEASLSYANLGTVKFVTTPANRATLKTTAKFTDQAAIWGEDNTVLGYPAYAAPCANLSMMYMGDFSKCVVGQWGGVEIVVDPYTDAKKGLINLTAIGLFDTGVVNQKGLVWKSNA